MSDHLLRQAERLADELAHAMTMSHEKQLTQYGTRGLYLLASRLAEIIREIRESQ